MRFIFFGTLLLALAGACHRAPEQERSDEAAHREQPLSQSNEVILQNGSLVGIHFLRHKPDYDPVAGEAFLREQYFPHWRDLMPNSRVHYLKGERGAQQGSDVFFWVFKDKASRNALFPERDEPTETYQERRASIDWLYTDTTFYRHNDGWVDSLSADYLVIAAGEPVHQDWLTPGSVVGIHHMVLKPGVDTAEFEAFIRDVWAPNRSDAVPGSKVFFLKGIRGNYEGSYAYMWVLESKERRDQLFPQIDQASTTYEELEAQWAWLYAEAHRGQFLKGWHSEKQNDFLVIQ